MYEFKYDLPELVEDTQEVTNDVVEDVMEEAVEVVERVKDNGVLRGSGRHPWGYVEDVSEQVSTSIFGKIAFGVGIAAIGVAAFFVYKNKSKIEEHQIKSLEKKGYIICKPENVQKAENTLKEVDSNDRI